MKPMIGLVATAILFATTACQEQAALPMLAVGKAAPDFRLQDASGKTVALSSFKGKTVVLEWNNPECPFVRKHYDSGNMQKTQAVARRDGAVWLSVNSGAPGKQGNMSPAQAKAQVAKEKSVLTAYLLDPSGKVGRLYGAKTTPHMFVISKSGEIVYNGGIDNMPTKDSADVKRADNYVLAALSALKAGKPVAVANSKPYGCAVKYSDS